MSIPIDPIHAKPMKRNEHSEEDVTPNKKKPPYESIMHYISHVESDYLNGQQTGTQSIEAKLIKLHTLYMAAWAIGELTWDEAYYAYADFTAKLLHVR